LTTLRSSALRIESSYRVPFIYLTGHIDHSQLLSVGDFMHVHRTEIGVWISGCTGLQRNNPFATRVWNFCVT
jgi:hypothetical protein